MNLQVSVANVTPQEMAEFYQGHEYANGELFAGSITANVGFGQWGIEPGSTASFGGMTAEHVETVLDVTRSLLLHRKESAAWVSGDDRPGHTSDGYLLLADGGNTDAQEPADPSAAFQPEA